MSIGHIAINGRPLLPPLANPQPSTDGPFRDGILSPNREPPFLLLVLIIALLFVGVVGSHTLCNPARAQQPKSTAIMPTADGRFTAPVVRVDSCFGDLFPALSPSDVLVQRHLYTACINTEARQPRWVAYVVRRRDWDSDNVLDRNFRTPVNLRDFCLEQSDFVNSGYELGHLYGLQFVSACDHAAEVNQLCAVAAQSADLNKGPWLKAENQIKLLSQTGPVTVLAGQLWLSPMPQLKNAKETHAVASHCWLIIESGNATVAYLFPQILKRDADLNSFCVRPDELRALISETWYGRKLP